MCEITTNIEYFKSGGGKIYKYFRYNLDINSYQRFMHRKTLSENQIQNNCLMVLLFSILLLQDAKKSQNEETVDDPLT